MIVEGFLLGMICAASLTASLFFLRFWRQTRDKFFLAFAFFFFAEAATRFSRIFSPHPGESSPGIYSIRLFALLLILIAIFYKNYGASQHS